MKTYTGISIDPMDPHPDQIHLDDIIHHSSLICRYCGATEYLYSVGQHVLMGLQFVKPENRLAWFFHDASESYLYDIISNVKELLPEYIAAEARLTKMIFEKFKVGFYDYLDVKRVDLGIMNTEAHALLKSTDGFIFPEPPLNIKIGYMDPRDVEQQLIIEYGKILRGALV